MFTIRMRAWPAPILAAFIAASPAGAQLAQAPAPSESQPYRMEPVRPPTRESQVAPSGMSPSDQELADRVFVQLAQRAWAGGDLQIRVNGGVVTVAGTVPDEAARHRVLRTIGRTAGVIEVRDQLRVDARRSLPPSQMVGDADLTQRVAREIAAALPGAKAGPDWWSRGWRVEGPGNQWNLVVEADQGRVLLEGDVPRTSILRLAVESALRTPGVRGVESDLDVDRRYRTPMEQPPLYAPPHVGGDTGDRRSLQRSGPPAGLMPPEPPAGTPRSVPPATVPRESVAQKTMMGEVVDVDRQTGRVRVRTSEGMIDLVFPMSGLQNVKPGDTVPVVIRVRESVRPSAGS